MKKIIFVYLTFLMFVNCNQTPENTEYLKLDRKTSYEELKEGWKGEPLIQMYKGKLLNGEVKDGTSLYFLESGKILKMITYSSTDFEKGKILEVRNYRKEGEFTGGSWGRHSVNQDGEFLQYHSNGNLQEKSFLKNGELEGEKTGYYNDGQISYKTFYKNGKREGEDISYFESGRISYKGSFIDDKEEGKHVWYFDTEPIQIYKEENYKNGKKHGKKFQYKETWDGKYKLDTESTWDMGTPIEQKSYL